MRKSKLTGCDLAYAVFRVLDHKFDDHDLMELALTHASVPGRNNQRLEFLGDAVLGLAVADALEELFPKADEGDMTIMRASLVCQDALAKAARHLRLAPLIRMSASEEKMGGRSKDSILSSTLEAMVGAAYIDAGPQEGLGIAWYVVKRGLRSEVANLRSMIRQKPPPTKVPSGGRWGG